MNPWLLLPAGIAAALLFLGRKSGVGSELSPSQADQGPGYPAPDSGAGSSGAESGFAPDVLGQQQAGIFGSTFVEPGQTTPNPASDFIVQAAPNTAGIAYITNPSSPNPGVFTTSGQNISGVAGVQQPTPVPPPNRQGGGTVVPL